MKFYLTDTIYIKDNIYYHEKGNKSFKIKETDWHIHLNDYGWNKLTIQWIKILNKLSLNKNKNSLFAVLDCGGDGNCLFNCINYAINGIDQLLNIDTFRLNFSESITYDVFSHIIDIYKISKEYGEFNETWDPFTITFEEFKEKIRIGGDEYWGDFLILNLLKDYLNINIIVLYNNDITNEYYHYPIFFKYDKSLQTMILFYEDEKHFRLVGKFKGNTMFTIFDHKIIPEEILRLINEIR